MKHTLPIPILCYPWEGDPRKLTCDSSLGGRYRNFAQMDVASLKADKTTHSNHVSLLYLLLDYFSNYYCYLPNVPCSFPWGHMVEWCFRNHFEPGLCHFQIKTWLVHGWFTIFLFPDLEIIKAWLIYCEANKKRTKKSLI